MDPGNRDLSEDFLYSGRYKAPTQSRGECQGDTSYLPSSQRSAPAGDFPSLVIEASHSQSEASLRNKAGWWLRQSNYTVKLVFIAKMELNQRSIWIEKWKGIPQPPAYQALVTRSRASLPLRPIEPGHAGPRINITGRRGHG